MGRQSHKIPPYPEAAPSIPLVEGSHLISRLQMPGIHQSNPIKLCLCGTTKHLKWFISNDAGLPSLFMYHMLQGSTTDKLDGNPSAAGRRGGVYMAMLDHWIWLTTRRGLGPRGVLQVLDTFGTPERAYYADGGELSQVEGLGLYGQKSLLDKSLEPVSRIMGDCDRLGLRIMTIQDADYPERLRQLEDAPAVLYIRGRVFHVDQEAVVGVVGSRTPSSYGSKVAARLGLELARGGILLASGIAQGIDCLAVQGALKGGGSAICVLGGGVDRVYPARHQWLYEDVAATGALVSEYPPGTPHKGEHFPIRNRIISGLSLGVAAVECRRYSGTMRTMEHAMEQGRDVFAVPGNIDAPMSEGTNWLIQQGAKPVTCAQDILEEYWARFPEKLASSAPLTPEVAQQRLEQIHSRTPPSVPRADAGGSASPRTREQVSRETQRERFTDDQLEILHGMEELKRACTVDELVERTQITARRVLSALTMLQVAGAVEEQPGKRFIPLVELESEG